MTNADKLDFYYKVRQDETIQQAIHLVIVAEGGYVNNPSDKGGETNYGITIASWNDYRTKQLKSGNLLHSLPSSVKDITHYHATEFYSDLFVKSGILQVKDNTVYLALFDYYVNAGKNAIITVQRLLADTDTILVDGYLGPKTADILNKYIDDFGSRDFIYSLTSRRIDHYIRIALGDKNQFVFLRGWINRSVKTLKDYEMLTVINARLNKLFAI